MALTWRRWGAWSAHLFDGDQQLCSTRHAIFQALADTGVSPVPSPEPAPLSSSGVPYGKVCTLCLRIYHRKGEE